MSRHLHEDAHAPFWFSTKSGMPPARRTGPRNVLAFQMVMSACCTAGPYRGGRCRCRRFVVPPTSISSPRRYRCPAGCRHAGHGDPLAAGSGVVHNEGRRQPLEATAIVHRPSSPYQERSTRSRSPVTASCTQERRHAERRCHGTRGPRSSV
jgi:hypothetical protein